MKLEYCKEGEGAESIRSLSQEGCTPGFIERQTYCFFPPSTGWMLFIDDEPIPLSAGEVPAWRWAPMFYAGQVTAELCSPEGNHVAKFRLDVSADPSKLGVESYRQLLADLWASDPELLLGDEPATTHCGIAGLAGNPSLALARMRRYFPSLLESLKAISRSPLTSHRSVRRNRPARSIRRVDRATLLSTLTNPSAVALVADRSSALSNFTATFDVPEHTVTYDCPANRTLHGAAVLVRNRLKLLDDALKEESNTQKQSETRTDLDTRLPRRRAWIRIAQVQLLQLLQSPPWSELTRSGPCPAGLNAVAAEPRYSRARRLAWQAVRPGFEGDPSDDRLWLSPTWEVYERWCFTRVMQQIEVLHPGLEWGSLGQNPMSRHMRGTGAGLQVDVYLQPRFNRTNSSSSKFRSISKLFIPDVVVTIAGSQRRFLVFDAKYQSSRDGLTYSMRSAHIYHDALRWHGQKPDLALLLAPSTREVDFLATRSFWDAEGVGVAELRPGSTSSLLDVLQS